MRFLAPFLALFLASCTHKIVQKDVVLAPVSALKPADLAGEAFTLASLRVQMKEISLPEARRPTIQFGEAGRVSGLAGVNRYSGTGELSAAGDLTWKGDMVLTRMAGPPEAMALEASFLAGLREINKAVLERGILRLTSADGGTKMEFRRP